MATQDLERLVVQLSADLTKYERAMARAQGITNKQLGAIQKKASSAGNAIGASFARTGAQIAAALLTGKVASSLASLSEAGTRIDNSLKVAGLSGAELEKVYDSLAKSAMANGAPIETLAALYGKAAQAQKELGVTSEELLGFTNNVALALRVAGTDAQTASGALLQLGQALGAGKVQAEEYNSILEGAPTIAQAVAAGLKEAGGSVSALKKLVIDGKISSEAFFRAFEAGAPMLEQKAAGATFTLQQSMTNLNTALISSVKEFNNSTGASENLANGINTLAKILDRFDVSGFIEEIRKAHGALSNFLNDLGDSKFFEKFAELVGATKDGLVVNVDKKEADAKVTALEAEVKMLQERIALNTSLGFDNTDALERIGQVRNELAALRAEAGAMPETVSGYKVGPGGLTAVPAPTDATTNGNMGGSSTRGGARKPVAVNPVSIKDFKAPVGSKGGGGKSKQSEYAREVQQIRERTAALQAETAAQATVNPLVDDYGYAMEKARTEHDLLAAAQEAGLAITPQLKTSIAQLAEGYAQASVEAQKLQESQEGVRQAAEDFKQTGKDVASGFINDLRQGKSMAEALAGALNKVVDKLIDVALNAAFGLGGTGVMGGGLLGGLFSLFGFARGGYTGNGGKYEPAGIVHKGEYVFDAKSTKKLGAKNLAKLAGYANGGMVGSAPRMPSVQRSASRESAVHVTVGVSADNNGNLMPFVESVSQRKVTEAAPRILSASKQQVLPTIASHQQQRAGGDYRG